VVLALLSFVLSACGGGGGDTPPTTNPPPSGGQPNNPPPPATLPEPTDWEQFSAEQSQLRITSIESSLQILWLDFFENELGFRVERRVGEGNWELVESLPAMSGGYVYSGPRSTEPTRYRVMALLDGRSIPLHSPGGETEFIVDPTPANLPTIQVDQTEPLRGAVQVSVQNAAPATAVRYTFGSGTFARATGTGAFSATLPAQHLLNGPQALQVYIEKSAGLTHSRIRSLQADNPAPAIVLYVGTEPLPIIEGNLSSIARASSAAGINAVEFFINGASVHVAHSTVAGTDQYVFPVDRATLPPGENVFRAVATDGANDTVAMEHPYWVNAVPTLNVTGLSNGMIASGTVLRISGTFSDDAAGANLAIDVDNRRVLRTLNSPFAVDVPLAGMAPGEHSAFFRVQDSNGRVSSRYYRFTVPSTP